jgi:hypothetical protein
VIVTSEKETRHERAMKLLEEGISQILDRESFKNYLRVMSRFHSYSLSNIFLIQAQRPGATRVAGYKKWQSMKRQVKKGEKGILIYVPIRRTVEDEDGNRATVVKHFGTGVVFDISQTEGEDLPNVDLPVSDLATVTPIGHRIADRLQQFLAQEQVTFAIENTKPAHGYYAPSKKHIAVDEDLRGDQFVKTLTHEVVHYVADHRGGTDRKEGETVAEGAAFVVLNHFGIDSSDYTFGYVAGWAREKEVLTRNLTTILQTARTVINALEAMGVEP